MELNRTGIYEIRNKINGKRYIGSTSVSFTKRWSSHKQCLKKNKHHSRYLQNAWNKYGKDNFEFKILEYVPVEFCIPREQWWLDLFGVYNPENGYNTQPTAGSSLGRIVTDETKEKIRKAHLGKKLSDETKEKLRQINLGKKYPLEIRLKLSEQRKGRTFSEESRRKIGNSNAKNTYKIICPDNTEVIVNNLTEFCRQHNLDQQNLNSVVLGKRNKHKGYRGYKL